MSAQPGGLKRWSVWTKQRCDAEWIEAFHCDGHPEELAQALYDKGYAEVGLLDNWQKFVRDGRLDFVGAMREIFGLKFRYLKPDPISDAATDFTCLDCGVDTSSDGIAEYYVVNDELWRSANPAGAGMLCVECIEKRIGRKLERDDFVDCLVNTDPAFRKSTRLLERLGGAS
jgi:hypothetical protein